MTNKRGIYMKNMIKKVTLISTLIIGSFSMSSMALANEYKNTIPVKKEVTQEIEDKVLVQQFLWHKCIHCYKLEESLDKWIEDKPDFIEFERIPVIWSNSHAKDARFLNYAKILEKTGKITETELTFINNELFNIVFLKEMEINSKNTFPIFEKYGVKTVEELEGLVNSFAIANENKRAKSLTDDYGISGVPMFVVNGKYIVGFQTLTSGAVNPENLFKTIENTSKGELEKSTKQ